MKKNKLTVGNIKQKLFSWRLSCFGAFSDQHQPKLENHHDHRDVAEKLALSSPKVQLKHEWLWDVLGVVLGLVILVAAYFIWQGYVQKQKPLPENQIVAAPITDTNKPYLLQEVDGRYKLLGLRYTYYLEPVDPQTTETLATLYDLAVRSVYEYLSGEMAVPSNYLVSRQQIFETVDIYVYNQINNDINESLSYQGMLVDQQQYHGGAVLLIYAGMLTGTNSESYGPMFYDLICQCLHLLSFNYDEASEKLCFGWRNYDNFTQSTYGKALDAGTTLWLADRIYQAYRYYILDAPAIVSQAPYTALYEMSEQLYETFGDKMILWYVQQDVDSMAQAFNQILQQAGKETGGAAEAKDNPSVAATLPIFEAVDKWRYLCQLTDPFDYGISGQIPADAGARYQEAMQILTYLDQQ